MSEHRAVIYVPAAPAESSILWQTRCLRHVEDRNYQLVGIVTDDDHGQGWRDIIHMTADGDVEVVVIADVSHLSPDRVPRIEVAGPVPHQPHPQQRRARGLRRPRQARNGAE